MSKGMLFVAKLAAVAALVAVTGCASVARAPAATDTASKQFMPKADVAQIYVYRNEAMGAALSMPVTLDGKLMGTTGPHSYFKFDVSSGLHKLTSQGDGSMLDVNAEAGKLYFVWQEVKMGLMVGGSKLQLVPAEQGKKGVLESTQILNPL